MSFFSNLQNLFIANNSSFLAQVLNGAGLGLVTTTSFIQFAEFYKARVIAEAGNLGLVSGILGISGLDKGLSMIIGAVLASVYIHHFAKGLRVIKND